MTFFYILAISLSFYANASSQDYSKRRLLLLAEHHENAELEKQLKIVAADSAGCDERNLQIQIITPASDKSQYDHWMGNKIGFQLILIGKDGGVKFTSDKPVSLQHLFGIIDAMPMRKAEIKEGSY